MASIDSTKFLSAGLQDSTAALDKFIPEIWGAAVQDYFEKKLVFGSLANDLSAMVAGGGDKIHLPKHGELVATDLYGATANNDALQTPLSFGAETTSQGEFTMDISSSAVAAVSITDIAKVQSSFDVMNLYASKLGYALAKKVDDSISKKLYSAVTFNDEDNSGADGASSGNNVVFTAVDSYNINAAGVANMLQAIYEADADIEDFTMILPPVVYSSLFKLAEFAKYDGTGLAGDSNPLISGFAGKLGGVPVIVSNNFHSVAADASASAQTASPVFNSADGNNGETDKLCGYLVHKDALHIAYAAGMKARVQSEYHLPSLATRFVADTVYGCLVTSDNSTNKKVFALTDAAS
tara:strand:+ start:519 stop:1574 length:1056 start_codon:yes stop_codon:yes gene_type:complete